MSSIDTNKLGNIDLNKPAFGPGAQTLNDLKPAEPSVEEPIIKEEEGVEEPEPSVEENKVPYSRFKNVNEARREAQAEAERWRVRAEELEQDIRRPVREEPSEEIPSYWKELYGDSDASKRAWDVQLRREKQIEERAYQAGQRGAEELEIKQQERMEKNIYTIDENFEELAGYVGRDLTEKEVSSIMDIVDDFTPKDEYGRYAGPLISFEKAWDMYELKQNSAKQVQRKNRDTVAALSGTSSQGETSVSAEQDKNFNPLERGGWRKRLGL